MRMLCGALLVMALAGPVSAQERDTALAVVPADTAVRTQQMVVGGLLGAAVGMFVGGAAGAGLELTLSSNCSDWCPLGGIALGAVVGETLGLAFGVHTGNRQRGSFAAAVVGPVAVTAGAILFASLFGDNMPGGAGPAFMVAIPVGQLMTSIAGERRAAQGR